MPRATSEVALSPAASTSETIFNSECLTVDKQKHVSEIRFYPGTFDCEAKEVSQSAAQSMSAQFPAIKPIAGCLLTLTRRDIAGGPPPCVLASDDNVQPRRPGVPRLVLGLGNVSPICGLRPLPACGRHRVLGRHGVLARRSECLGATAPPTQTTTVSNSLPHWNDVS